MKAHPLDDEAQRKAAQTLRNLSHAKINTLVFPLVTDFVDAIQDAVADVPVPDDWDARQRRYAALQQAAHIIATGTFEEFYRQDKVASADWLGEFLRFFGATLSETLGYPVRLMLEGPKKPKRRIVLPGGRG